MHASLLLLLPWALSAAPPDIFLSYAHSDRPFVEKLYRWLQESAGLQAWWDDRDLSAGAMLATDLQRAIERCRAVLLVASDESLARGWVLNEYNAAMDQRANFRGFRMVALRMGGAQVEELMKGISWINVGHPGQSSACLPARKFCLRAAGLDLHRGQSRCCLGYGPIWQ